MRRAPHFLPNAALLLPVVKRFAVDFVNGSFGHGQFAGLHGHEEIDVVHSAVVSLHIHTGEVFVAAEIREPVVMNFDQVQAEIFMLIRDVKLVVGRFCSVAANESLQSI